MSKIIQWLSWRFRFIRINTLLANWIYEISEAIHLNRLSQERMPAGDMSRIIRTATVTGWIRQIGAVLARGSRTVTPIPSGGRHSVVVGVTAVLTPTRLMHWTQLSCIILLDELTPRRQIVRVYLNNFICFVNHNSVFARICPKMIFAETKLLWFGRIYCLLYFFIKF